MMKRFSGVYKFNGKSFIYDYEDSVVRWVTKLSKEEKKDNEEWKAEHGHYLYDVDENGYHEIDGVGLRRENWKNKEIRDSYLQQWCDEIDEEVAWIAANEEF